MHIIQFWRILWARRMLVVAMTLSCLAGGLVLTMVLPARYESTARVMLGLLKPDPLSGQMLAGSAAGAYANTQAQLITDYTVASKVVDALGWNSDPQLIDRYHNRSSKDQRDFSHWAAQLVIDGTTAKLLEGSNILEITYRASNPRAAKAVADVLEKAYMDTSVAMKRDDATRQADWFEQQADKAREELASAEDAKAAYERANGVYMEDDQKDLETARLQMLAQQGAVSAPAPPQTPQSAIELAQLDAQIAQQSKVLGPNHPELQAMKARRAVLAGLVAKDEAAERAYAAGPARAFREQLDAQESTVIAKSDKLEHLRELQAEVNLKRDQLNKATESAATYRQQAAVVDTGLTPLGPASTPSTPSFPKPIIIVPGCIVLGFVFGVLLALLLEFLARRVRGAEDMRAVADVPLLVVVPAYAKAPRARRFGGRLTRLGRKSQTTALIQT